MRLWLKSPKMTEMYDIGGYLRRYSKSHQPLLLIECLPYHAPERGTRERLYSLTKTKNVFVCINFSQLIVSGKLSIKNDHIVEKYTLFHIFHDFSSSDNKNMVSGRVTGLVLSTLDRISIVFMIF